MRTSCLRREPLDRLPEATDEEGNTDEPPENILSCPAITGENVEKVVPLAARDDIDGLLLLRYRGPPEERELTDSLLLRVDAGLAAPARCC